MIHVPLDKHLEKRLVSLGSGLRGASGISSSRSPSPVRGEYINNAPRYAPYDGPRRGPLFADEAQVEAEAKAMGVVGLLPSSPGIERVSPTVAAAVRSPAAQPTRAKLPLQPQQQPSQQHSSQQRLAQSLPDQRSPAGPALEKELQHQLKKHRQRLLEAEARAARAEAQAETLKLQADKLEAYWKGQVDRAEQTWKQQAEKAERDAKEWAERMAAERQRVEERAAKEWHERLVAERQRALEAIERERAEHAVAVAGQAEPGTSPPREAEVVSLLSLCERLEARLATVEQQRDDAVQKQHEQREQVLRLEQKSREDEQRRLEEQKRMLEQDLARAKSAPSSQQPHGAHASEVDALLAEVCGTAKDGTTSDVSKPNSRFAELLLGLQFAVESATTRIAELYDRESRLRNSQSVIEPGPEPGYPEQSPSDKPDSRQGDKAADGDRNLVEQLPAAQQDNIMPEQLSEIPHVDEVSASVSDDRAAEDMPPSRRPSKTESVLASSSWAGSVSRRSSSSSAIFCMLPSRGSFFSDGERIAKQRTPINLFTMPDGSAQHDRMAAAVQLGQYQLRLTAADVEHHVGLPCDVFAASPFDDVEIRAEQELPGQVVENALPANFAGDPSRLADACREKTAVRRSTGQKEEARFDVTSPEINIKEVIDGVQNPRFKDAAVGARSFLSVPAPTMRSTRRTRSRFVGQCPRQDYVDEPLRLYRTWQGIDGHDPHGDIAVHCTPSAASLLPCSRKAAANGSLVVHEASVFGIAFGILGALLVLYEFVTVPLLAFDFKDSYVSDAFLIAIAAYWALDFLRRFYYLPEKSIPGSCALNCGLLFDYLMVALDVLIALEAINLLPWPPAAADELTSGTGWKAVLGIARWPIILRVVRLVRAARVRWRLSGATTAIAARTPWPVTCEFVLGILEPICISLLCCHISACGFFWVGTSYRDEPDAWVPKHFAGKDESQLGYAYLVCFQWSLCHFTLAESDVLPGSKMERVYAVCVACASLALSAWMFARVVSIAAQLAFSRNRHRESLLALRRYLKERDVNAHLQRRVWEYLSIQPSPPNLRGRNINAGSKLEWASETANTAKLLENLPAELMCLLDDILRVPVLLKHPLLAWMIDEHSNLARHLCRCLEVFPLVRGDVLFEVGERGRHAFVATRGDLRYAVLPASRSQAPKINLVQPGAWLGEPALWFENWRRQGRASVPLAASMPSEVVAMQAAALQEVLLLAGVQPAFRAAAAYARAYVKYTEEHGAALTDVSDPDDLVAVVHHARDHLEASQLKQVDGECAVANEIKAERPGSSEDSVVILAEASAGAGVGAGVIAPQAEIHERFEALARRADSLVQLMPTKSNRIRDLCGTSIALQEEVVTHAEGTRPIVHHKLLRLVESFLSHKLRHGSDVERNLYEGMDVVSQIERLLTMRPFMFATASDEYLLRDGTTRGFGTHGPLRFDDIGTDLEQFPLLLQSYQSYDEMELSALIGVSAPTHFINRGNRTNSGLPERPGSFQHKGVYVGLVGARLERADRMDWKHMAVTREQNTEENGYGVNGAGKDHMLSEWASFYGFDYFPTYEEAEEITRIGGQRFVPMDSAGALLDTAVYAARCELIAELFLVEANHRAQLVGANAFCHIIGLGLGARPCSDKQAQIQIDAYAIVMRRLNLAHVGELHFSCFPCSTCGGTVDGVELRSLSGTPVRVTFGQRDTADPLPHTPPGAKPWLLVAQYAWDANSYPGNEYWNQQMCASSSSAAACCSTIAELQNPHVNIEAFSSSRLRVLRIFGIDASLEELGSDTSAT